MQVKIYDITLFVLTGIQEEWNATHALSKFFFWACTAGDLHKNNPLWKKKHEMTLRPNYFTPLTFLCGAVANASHLSMWRPWERRHTLSAGRLEPPRMTECVAGGLET
jgi:hypothetical protein